MSYTDRGKPVIGNNLRLESPIIFEPTIEGLNKLVTVVKLPQKLLVPWQGFKDFEFYCRDQYGSGKEDCSKTLKAAP